MSDLRDRVCAICGDPIKHRDDMTPLERAYEPGLWIHIPPREGHHAAAVDYALAHPSTDPDG